jgi:hypothetical protein
MHAIYQEMYNSLALGPISLETNKRLINSLAKYVNEIDTLETLGMLFDCIKTRTAYRLKSHYMDYRILSRQSRLREENLVSLFLDSTFSWHNGVKDFEDGLPTLVVNFLFRW